MTFASTANAVAFMGAKPIFADVDQDTLLIDPSSVERLLGPKTKAIVAVDYAGQPCNYDTLQAMADEKNIALVADACHALGAEFKGRKSGTLAQITAFSFHPVKHVTTGEGGMVTTNDLDVADRMRRFRSHCITDDHHDR